MDLLNVLMDAAGDDAPVGDVAIGAFVCMVSSRHAGLSSSFRGRCGAAGCASAAGGAGLSRAGDLAGMSARRLAGYAASDNLLEASVGVAALNSLIAPPPAALAELNASEVIARTGAGKRVAVIGHFPFVERLRGAAEVRLIQREPWDREGALREAEAKIPGCDVVAVTGSSLINRTFGRLLSLARGAYVIVIGASTPLSPALFRLGVSALCGTVVDDADAARRALTQGATFREMRGIRRVTIFAPGAELP
ncbi:MAG: DUF364 domain-containing protein [bacterium]|nr:DUF364 domain-containing protein [bacterium]